jgi:hypothetical protein
MIPQPVLLDMAQQMLDDDAGAGGYNNRSPT